MSVTIVAKYPGVATPHTLKNVTYETTIEQLVKVLIKINKSEAAPEQVLIVHKGRVLSTDTKVGDLTLDESQTATIFVTGMKNNQKKPEPAPQPAANIPAEPLPELPRNPPQNNPPPFNNMFNQPQPQPQFNNRPAQTPQFRQNTAPREDSMLNGLLIAGGVLFLLIVFVYNLSTLASCSWGQLIFWIIFTGGFFAFLFRNVKWSIPLCAKVIKHYFFSITPFWNQNDFLQEMGAQIN